MKKNNINKFITSINELFSQVTVKQLLSCLLLIIGFILVCTTAYLFLAEMQFLKGAIAALASNVDSLHEANSALTRELNESNEKLVELKKNVEALSEENIKLKASIALAEERLKMGAMLLLGGATAFFVYRCAPPFPQFPTASPNNVTPALEPDINTAVDSRLAEWWHLSPTPPILLPDEKNAASFAVTTLAKPETIDVLPPYSIPPDVIILLPTAESAASFAAGTGLG